MTIIVGYTSSMSIVDTSDLNDTGEFIFNLNGDLKFKWLYADKLYEDCN